MATSIKLNDTLISEIKRLAELQHRSPHWIMCEAIREYVARETARENLKAEALASWAAYQETGRHLNQKEVQDWLSTWGTPSEKKIPPCHE